jgi:CheY-like chemotaxis protein
MSKRILAVEDQPDNRQIIRDMLAPTDYEITEAREWRRGARSDRKAAT